MSIRGTFPNSTDLEVVTESDKYAVIQISTVLRQLYHVACRRVLWDVIFRHLSDHRFGVRNFGNTKSMRVMFFSKYLKFIVDFKNATKNWENVFCFWDNCFWIGIVKLSLLRTGYFSSAANVLTSSPKILHVNKRNVFQLNWFGSDQWIW